MLALGDFIDGRFVSPEGVTLRSVNPADGKSVVLETGWSRERAEAACSAAGEQRRSWVKRSLDQRWELLRRFQEAIADRAEALTDAIVLETGKIRSEARAEVQTVLGRFGATWQIVHRKMRDETAGDHPRQVLRRHPLGSVAVIGPANFPIHLCHAYALPAMLLGNTVVVKPSELTPLCGQRYAEAAQAAGLPPGVFNLVQGGAEVGDELVRNDHIRGLCFTGSYETGQKIKAASLDRPELLLALETGGKNMVLVMEDADLRHALHEIVSGAYLTAGQRCTATERVLVDKRHLDELLAGLEALVKELRFGDPNDPSSFAGPLMGGAARERFLSRLSAAEEAGAEVIIPARGEDPGFWVRPSLHFLPIGHSGIRGYTDMELFGPDLSVEAFDSEDEALHIMAGNPYGLVNSVFTSDRERFNRLFRESFCGMLNLNRSTNNASPMLPFGGVGRSGNHRPGGSYAVYNVTYPVAQLEVSAGAIEPHPALTPHLPAPDLDRMEAMHSDEETSEARRNLLNTPRPRRLCLPQGGQLPKSEAWLQRLYSGNRVVREKKPPVFDHLRSSDAWLASIDDEPLCVLDAMSQTSTLPAGFGADEVARAYLEGDFGASTVAGSDPATSERYGGAYTRLLQRLTPELPFVSYTNSGAEANEKALALCRLHALRPDADRIVAFQGSFHGRTLLALHSSWNPEKRRPFELPGYEVAFAPFPVWLSPNAGTPPEPEGFLSLIGSGDLDGFAKRYASAEDPLVREEARSLITVHDWFEAGRVFACIVEPMQAEGGDRYATPRFFRALRILTRLHNVPLIFDEVQVGCGLGGPFLWHHQFNLVTKDYRRDAPDAVTLAKRAQVGVCVSRFPDPEPTSAHPASLVRGRIHAEFVLNSEDAQRVEELVNPELAELQRRFPDLVLHARSQGYAFAFDLPSPELLQAFLGQRFWRGAIAFAAGDRTARYRLSAAFGSREIGVLFEAIRRSLSWLDAHPGKQPPLWEEAAPSEVKPTKSVPTRVRRVNADETETLLRAVIELEKRVYEVAQQDPVERLRIAFENPDGIALVAEALENDTWNIVGCALGGPLEAFASVEGPDRDWRLGQENTFYSSAITVDAGYQGLGLGRKLKVRQIQEARQALRVGNGEPRYRYLTGRNRVGNTQAMMELNKSLGGYTIALLSGQYGEPHGKARYYCIPIRALAPARASHVDRAGSEQRTRTADLDLTHGIERPFVSAPDTLTDAEERGLLFGPTVNKITLSNYVTPAVVRAVEWVTALQPALGHLYLTSSRDETVDKALRILRWHRTAAVVAIGMEGGYVGHTTAAARSLSDGHVHKQGPGHFAWPRFPHPAEVGAEAAEGVLRRQIQDAGGPEKILGIVLEIVQERTGRVVPNEFWESLGRLGQELDVPVVVCETSTAGYRSGIGPFASSQLPFMPNALIWWAGGQVGFVHVDDRYFVPDPLAMISTWDGDELSLVRLHHQLRAARRMDVENLSSGLGYALDPVRSAGIEVRGLGLFRAMVTGRRTDEIHTFLGARGLHLCRMSEGVLGVIPSLDQAEEAARRLRHLLFEWMRKA